MPEDLVKQFCSRCTRCITRRSLAQPVAANPILTKGFMCRLQVDLVDMHNRPDDSYKYICHARDHFTKFSWTTALFSKEAKEVASFLFQLFTAFGPPTILQTDNGKEFTANIIRKLTEMWPTIRIINGRPRHPQSQGLIERANDVLQQKLSKWMEDKGTNNWSHGLYWVTCKKHCFYIV